MIENKARMIEHIKLWDFNNNNKVKYKHFKDALAAKFSDFLKPKFRDILITIAHKYLIFNENGGQDEAYLDYINFFAQFN
jgi:hypothetical protein